MSSPEGDNEEVFEDAAETIDEMDMNTAMEQAKMAVDCFFNNRFVEAKNLMQPWADTSMYHALGYGTFMYLQAVMTFDPLDIETAVTVLKQSVEVCNRKRRKNTLGESIGRMVKKADYYNAYTEEEIHAELCYAECLLLRAILSFIEDETLISFLKGSMKIRACYLSYRECWHILESRDFSNDKQQIHFESGVRMGVGTFNLMITQLPNKILKLLEFVGFAPSRPNEADPEYRFGLSELERGFALAGSLRKVMCGLALLVYHTFAVYSLGHSEGDIDKSQEILDDQLKSYPKGALFLFFRARMNFIKGELDSAAIFYEKSRQSQSEWRQFHHLCYWELYWCYLLTGKYKEAEHCAEILLQESKWSKAIYAYIKVCCLCMRQDSLTPLETDQLRETMRSIPELKQRIAGKSIPMEKFAVKKSLRFFSQGGRLSLAATELIYTFNQMKILGKSFVNVERFYLLAEAEISKLLATREEDLDDHYWDNLSLSHLMKGVCLVQMKSPLQALECFKFVLDHEKKIKVDTYLVPFTLLEVALLHLNEGDLDQAKLILDHTKHSYKGFSLESRLLFRVHSAQSKIRELKKKQSLQNPPSSTLKLPKEPFIKLKRSPSPINAVRTSFTHLNGSGEAHVNGTEGQNGASAEAHVNGSSPSSVRHESFSTQL